MNAERKSEDYGLSRRELDVLRLMAGGLSDEEIAFKLGITPLTETRHVRAIRVKMGTHSRTEAALRAIREGLID